MRMGMHIMTGSQFRFCLRMVGRMRIWVIHGVVVFFLIMTFLVLAGLCSGVRLLTTGVFSGFMPR
jgi:hypothetical protein